MCRINFTFPSLWAGLSRLSASVLMMSQPSFDFGNWVCRRRTEQVLGGISGPWAPQLDGGRPPSSRAFRRIVFCMFIAQYECDRT